MQIQSVGERFFDDRGLAEQVSAATGLGIDGHELLPGPDRAPLDMAVEVWAVRSNGAVVAVATDRNGAKRRAAAQGYPPTGTTLRRHALERRPWTTTGAVAEAIEDTTKRILVETRTLDRSVVYVPVDKKAVLDALRSVGDHDHAPIWRIREGRTSLALLGTPAGGPRPPA